MGSISEFCRSQKELLEQEFQYDSSIRSTGTKQPTAGDKGQQQEEGGRRTRVLRKLVAAQVSVGLYGRTVIQFREDDDRLLPAHKFTTGDEIEIRNKNNEQKNNPSGVVSEVTDISLSIALFAAKNDLETTAFFEQPPFSLIPVSNVQVHKKMTAALSDLEQKGVDHKVCGNVVRCLFHPPAVGEEPSVVGDVKISPFNTNLDESQVNAISFALSEQRPVTLIHGPPGTGKTTTVAELIRQAVQNYGLKVLVAAPSNVAVDNLLARLASSEPTPTRSKSSSKRLRMVRLGHPARLQPEILPYSLEALVQRADGTEIVKDVRNELQSYLKVLSDPRARNKRLAYKEMKVLRKEIRVREEKVVDELIRNAQVVMATCVGAANHRILRDIEFDIVVIDEAAQALEAACWIPILRGKKLVMAGDHLQLPPTIQCDSIQKQLGETLFERMMKLYHEESGKDGRVSRMLKIQYRMNENIANWASTNMYGGELLTHDSIKAQRLSEMKGVVVDQVDDLLEPLVLIDTAGCAMYETENAAGSRFNEGEAQLVEKHVLRLIEAGVAPEQIAVITPYNGQVEIVKRDLLPQAPKLQIRSVDGFQGGEREAVVLSLVRSNEKRGNIGFLRDERRLNVAVTRAKRHCCIVCDTETVSTHAFIRSLVDWVGENGNHVSALELLDDDFEIADTLIHSSIGAPPAKPKQDKSEKQQEEDEQRKQELRSEIEMFVTSAKPGDELIMSDAMTKFDRFLVHELAEEFCIGHSSEGKEGVNRRVKLWLPTPNVGSAIEQNDHKNEVSTGPEAISSVSNEKVAAGGPNTEPGDPADGSGLLNQIERIEAQHAVKLVEESTEEQGSSSLLKVLARDRATRQRQKNALPKSIQPQSTSKTKQKRGKKLGGTKKPTEKFDTMDELDEMAFLDAQIDKVQNSHGVKFEGSGKKYRTVVNGILISKPKKAEPKRNERASTALQTKLKEAQAGRKSKAKPKK